MVTCSSFIHCSDRLKQTNCHIFHYEMKSKSLEEQVVWDAIGSCRAACDFLAAVGPVLVNRLAAAGLEIAVEHGVPEMRLIMRGP